VRRKNGTILYRGRMSDPVDGEAFLEVIDDLSAPSGPDDQRELKRRRAAGLKDLVEDARGPHGVAADARRDSATEPEDGTGVEDAWIPAPRRSDAGDQASRRADRPGRAPRDQVVSARPSTPRNRALRARHHRRVTGSSSV